MQARAAEQLSDAMSGMVTKGNVEAEQEAARKKEEKRLAQEAEDARKVCFCLCLSFLGSCFMTLVAKYDGISTCVLCNHCKASTAREASIIQLAASTCLLHPAKQCWSMVGSSQVTSIALHCACMCTMV